MQELVVNEPHGLYVVFDYISYCYDIYFKSVYLGSHGTIDGVQRIISTFLSEKSV